MSRVAGRAVDKDINMLILYVISGPENEAIFSPISSLQQTAKNHHGSFPPNYSQVFYHEHFLGLLHLLFHTTITRKRMTIPNPESRTVILECRRIRDSKVEDSRMVSTHTLLAH